MYVLPGVDEGSYGSVDADAVVKAEIDDDSKRIIPVIDAEMDMNDSQLDGAWSDVRL